MRHVVIVGASLAGISTARALRAQGYDGALTLVGAEPHRPYDRPPLSKEFLTATIEEPELSLEMPGEDLGITWRLGTAAGSLDAERLVLRLSDGEELAADGIVLATGAAPVPLPGTPQLPGVHLLRTVDDARRLRDDLRQGGRLVVVGGGFIGSEVASTGRHLGLDVTVVEAADLPLIAQLGPEMARVVSGLHAQHGTRLECGVGVAGLVTDADAAGAVTGVELVDGRVLPADVVVVGIGARPVTAWLEGSGLELAAGHRGVVCDAAGATDRPGVVAVGDCAAWYDEASGGPARVEHWTAAHERGPLAAATLLGLDPPRLRGGPAPYFWSDQYGRRIQFAGLARPADEVAIEEGSIDEGSLLAVYRRGGEPVAVLGIDRPRPFTRWRRALGTPPVVSSTAVEH
jgi:NADPH-dependent 2,4-dienoyl-CoA reductase/sulfur reductase-like enzyme